ncbi:c-type cytochrome [Azospira restricta]|uniref:C-type cytochrome n=2 Tax=Azospira restricta TaxID=404405 RepID=A0A974PXC7_9RHOO|nr:c-type cytochrome [Azospira restricta]
MKTNAGILAVAMLVALSGPAAAESKLSLIGRAAPAVENLPNDEYGDLVRYGQQLSVRTFAHIGPEVQDTKMRFAGNNLACTSCHQENATKPYAMPWVGVSAVFPQYRAREDELSTVEERVNGCMQRSMAGRPLPLDSREMKAFVTYIHFLSRDVPVGARIEGAATRGSKPPNRRADLAAGESVYKAQCMACHGENGEGRRNGVPGDAQGYQFPPVWGPDSFNTGAGMNRILMAMRFIKHNMPQGVNHAAPVLSDDEAFDVAGFILSKPRPEKKNLEQDFPARWNKPIDAAFPPYVDGAPADQHKYGPFPPLAEKARAAAAAREETKKTRENRGQ